MLKRYTVEFVMITPYFPYTLINLFIHFFIYSFIYLLIHSCSDLFYLLTKKVTKYLDLLKSWAKVDNDKLWFMKGYADIEGFMVYLWDVCEFCGNSYYNFE